MNGVRPNSTNFHGSAVERETVYSYRIGQKMMLSNYSGRLSDRQANSINS